MNCTARFEDRRLELWVPTQAPTLARKAAASAIEIPEENVTVHMTLCGGGFGRRGETSFVRQAAVMAAETGGAVKVIWAREEDIQHDAYRPAMAYRFRALVGSSGDLEALEERIAGPGVWANTRPELVRGRLDPLAVEGLTDRTYAIPNHVVEYVMTEAHLPIGYWRSVGYSHNVFFRESAIDEAAYANDQDPTSSDAPC